MSGAVSKDAAKGTTPAGAHSEREAAAWVRGMFGRVAHRYDFLNHLLSFNVDRYWRAYTMRRVRHILERPGARVLDLCCGTGDLALALERRSRSVVLGSDFCHPMLVSARGKVEQRQARVALFESDALRLPVRDASMDLVTVAFGFRNLANYEAGLAEMRRVLRPGGVAAILEFSQPPNALLPEGEFRWDGVGGTFFFIDPKDDMFAILMMQSPSQHGRIQDELKTLIYQALVK